MQKPSLALLVATAALAVSAMAWMRSADARPVPAPVASVLPPARPPVEVKPVGPMAAATPLIELPAQETAIAGRVESGRPSFAVAGKSLSSVVKPAYRPAAATTAQAAPAAASSGVAPVSVLPASGAVRGSAYSSPVAAAAPLWVELDRGVQLPAALVETDRPLTPVQAAAKQQLTDEFGREVAGVMKSPAGSPEATDKTWTDARARANARYKLLFGNAAFNRASISAGLDALAE